MTSEFAIAVHALVFLNHKGETLSSDALADNVCTNPARVRKVMAPLKSAGLVGTREGVKGGYYMTLPADQLTLAQISDALRMPLIKASWKTGSVDKECLVASGMAGIMDGIYGELNDLCLRHLAHITIQDIDDRIFHSRSSAT
ncbi:RrF2 family transcriptional regulator [Ruminococcus gauvreauii]|uniref:Rrf2 family transcriptional regulator n=1 Tax=Ruminococcus gauvreauii TaxID=438033 RepID=A0ABY5VE33_9FIRM|nr:Rrf2 family transcriptional regulator [Ruminococcus gauvreauii]UWP58526.1 Rrf2 family transcriptional regulator [Ruminococcus gauvreauii]